MKTALCAALLLICSCPLFSQTRKPRIGIVFDCQCQDDTGTRFASTFRKLLASSLRYEEVSNAVEHRAADKDVAYHWHLKVISIDGSTNGTGANAALSLVLLRGEDIFVTQSVQFCGRQKAVACAESAFRLVDGHVGAWGE